VTRRYFRPGRPQAVAEAFRQRGYDVYVAPDGKLGVGHCEFPQPVLLDPRKLSFGQMIRRLRDYHLALKR
jgi:hypothetical protein